jgi:hypothetical protein
MVCNTFGQTFSGFNALDYASLIFMFLTIYYNDIDLTKGEKSETSMRASCHGFLVLTTALSQLNMLSAFKVFRDSIDMII